VCSRSQLSGRPTKVTKFLDGVEVGFNRQILQFQRSVFAKIEHVALLTTDPVTALVFDGFLAGFSPPTVPPCSQSLLSNAEQRRIDWKKALPNGSISKALMAARKDRHPARETCYLRQTSCQTSQCEAEIGPRRVIRRL